MAEPKKLRLGTMCPSPTIDEEETRIAVLRATINRYVPDFEKAVQDMAAEAGDDKPEILLHQDAFAAAYDDDEYTLFGMAMKYAGLYGVGVQITGSNGESM